LYGGVERGCEPETGASGREMTDGVFNEKESTLKPLSTYWGKLY